MSCRGSRLDGATPHEGFRTTVLLWLGLPKGLNKLFIQLRCFCFLFLRLTGTTQASNVRAGMGKPIADAADQEAWTPTQRIENA